MTKAERRFEKKKEGLGVGLKWIETQDELRYSNPEKVIQAAELQVDEVELELLPRFLGVVGSAFGQQFLLDEAEHCLQAGLQLDIGIEGSFRGTLLTRLSYVTSNRGDFQGALLLAREAVLTEICTGDLHGLGRALVALGSRR